MITGNPSLTGRITISAVVIAVPEQAWNNTPRARKRLCTGVLRAFQGMTIQTVEPGVFHISLRQAVPFEKADALLAGAHSRLQKSLGPEVAKPIGLSTNIPLAKAALLLPPGKRFVLPGVDQVAEALAGTRLSALPGLQLRDATRLNLLGVFTVSDFAHANKQTLQDALGTSKGAWWFHALRGFDIPPAPPSVSTVSRVMNASHRNRDAAFETLTRLVRRGIARLMKNGMAARCTTIVAWSPVKQWTRSIPIERFDSDALLDSVRTAWREMNIEQPERVSVRFQGIHPIEQRTLLFEDELGAIEISGSPEESSESAA